MVLDFTSFLKSDFCGKFVKKVTVTARIMEVTVSVIVSRILLFFLLIELSVSNQMRDTNTNDFYEILSRTTRRAKKKSKKMGIRFDQSKYNTDVNDDMSVGRTILIVSASFKKARKGFDQINIAYRISDASLRSADPNDFPIELKKSTGELKVRGPLNANSRNRYSFKIEAFVVGKRKLSASSVVTIDVRVAQLAVGFTQQTYHGYIMENVFGDVNVSIALDSNELSGEEIIYEIVDVTPEFVPPKFGIDRLGIVYVAYPLDREDNDLYFISIMATQGSFVSRTMLIVHVDDQNDNPPRFPYDSLRMNVFENLNLSLAGETRVNASDADIGQNAKIRYHILFGGNGIVRIDPESGQLYNLINLDYEKIKRMKLVIGAYSGELYTTCKVFIFIRDENDNAPIVNDFEIFYNALPNTLRGAEIAKIPVRDLDTVGTIRFGILADGDSSIRRAREHNMIEIDHVTGMIRINPAIQAEDEQEIDAEMGIYVFDGVHASTARFRIRITGISDRLVANSVSAHILNITEKEFLRKSGIQILRNTTKELLGASSVTIFNIQEFSANNESYVKVSFSAKRETGEFFSPVEVLNLIYFEMDKMETMCGFAVNPAEEDNCLAEMCNKRQRCVTRKTIRREQLTYHTTIDDLMLEFYGIPPMVEQWCECLAENKHGNCSRLDLCSSQPCFNNGTCYENFRNMSYACICTDGFSGKNCEIGQNQVNCYKGACKFDELCQDLPGAGFQCVCNFNSGCHQRTSWHFPIGAYLAFPTLQLKSTVKISLNFSTFQTNGLLLYVGRFSQQYDFLALEIVRGKVSFTFNVGRFIMRIKVGIPGGVSDGNWHNVELVYHEKVVEVILDGCKDDQEFSDFECAAYATQALDVTTWFLDVNTPFIMGTLPMSKGDSRILNRDFEGCITDVRLNDKLLSHEDIIWQKFVEPGCPWYKRRNSLTVNDDDTQWRG